jgi:hypothetical protein
MFWVKTSKENTISKQKKRKMTKTTNLENIGIATNVDLIISPIDQSVLDVKLLRTRMSQTKQWRVGTK